MFDLSFENHRRFELGAVVDHRHVGVLHQVQREPSDQPRRRARTKQLTRLLARVGDADCCAERSGRQHLGVTDDELRVVHRAFDDGALRFARLTLGYRCPLRRASESEGTESTLPVAAVEGTGTVLRQAPSGGAELLPGATESLEVTDGVVVGHAVAVVRHDDPLDRIKFSAADGDRHRLGFGIEGVPDQLGDARERLGRARQAVVLVRIDLDGEAGTHARRSTSRV